MLTPRRPPRCPPRAQTAQARIDEGEAFFEQKKVDEAIAAFRAAVEKDPEMSAAWYRIGLTEMAKNGGHPCEGAHDPFKRCVELNPKDVDAHCGLGHVLLLSLIHI